MTRCVLNLNPTPANVSDADEAPNVLPVLSSSATNINSRKLMQVPWDHSGKHPGNRPFWSLLTNTVDIAWSYLFRRVEIDHEPTHEGGLVYASIHINGLVDPLAIMKSQSRRIISIGRHDIMTMPVIGWLTRRMGSQPVIRKAEIEGGFADKELATKINQRSMLTMANCIASGHAAIVMPEGKSHQDSHLHALRTGPLRFTLNAASIAHHRGLDNPMIQPVGLHYRCHHWFRTDIYVEFGEPLIIPLVGEEETHRRVSEGEWIEPPAEHVIPLKEELFDKLSPITPDAPDWETYRAWHLLGHRRANQDGSRLSSYKEEVLAAREVRDSSPTDSVLNKAREVAQILHSHDLDSRSLDSEGRIKRESPFFSAILGSLLMLLSSPISIPSTGLQAFIGWYVGDRTDEGVDARTTHHMIGAVFSPLLMWPLISFIAGIFVVGLEPVLLAFVILSLPVFHISNLVFLRGYDLWVDYGDAKRRNSLANSEEGRRLEEVTTQIDSELVVLK
tara:strand:- start:1998 stop:3509 length:1512 start_codon:yes stop_codon:yes gene_type:complete